MGLLSSRPAREAFRGGRFRGGQEKGSVEGPFRRDGYLSWKGQFGEASANYLVRCGPNQLVASLPEELWKTAESFEFFLSPIKKWHSICFRKEERPSSEEEPL